MSTSTVFLVCYDIADSRRLARTRRVLLGFGEPLQFSVFRCVLIPSALVKLKEKISKEINAREDRVLFANLGPADGRGADSIDGLGKRIDDIRDRSAIVI